MNDRNETIIDAVIKKADALCPDSLALIGVYGSVATGDEYGKSDLDLMILINDENGQVLADGFIIDDVDEEMYSNWKNKMAEAAGRNDVYSSFMNLLSLQWMFYEIAECIAVDGFEIMDKFNAKSLEENVDVFNQVLNKYLAEYEKAGIRPRHFESMTDFAEDYNKEISEEI